MNIQMNEIRNKFVDLNEGDVFKYKYGLYMKTQEAELYNMNHVNAVRIKDGTLEYFDKGTEIEYCKEAVLKI